MNIYVSSNQLKRDHEMTPMHAYLGSTDFSVTLNDIHDGNFPVGTNQPFPVNFQSEENNDGRPTSPWTQNNSLLTSDPPPDQIFGPKAFGL